MNCIFKKGFLKTFNKILMYGIGTLYFHTTSEKENDKKQQHDVLFFSLCKYAMWPSIKKWGVLSLLTGKLLVKIK